jgi:hypothetical protein
MKRIDRLLEDQGWFQRADLQEMFGTSTAQSSIDIKEYLSLRPEGHVVYNRSRRRYERGPSYQGETAAPVDFPERAMAWNFEGTMLRNGVSPVALARFYDPKDVETMKRILAAGQSQDD